VASDPNWRPQAIVVSLGTNDFATPLHDGEKWTRREQLQADFVTNYANFVHELHQRHPQAYTLLWAAGSEDSELVTEVRKVVKRVQQSGNTRIGFVPVPNLAFSGCHHHPSVADDQSIALALTRHLEAHVPSLGYLRAPGLKDGESTSVPYLASMKPARPAPSSPRVPPT
jgi:hypothetical protein